MNGAQSSGRTGSHAACGAHPWLACVVVEVGNRAKACGQQKFIQRRSLVMAVFQCQHPTGL